MTMKQNRYTQGRKRHPRAVLGGFTLIELIVSLALTMVIATVIFQMYNVAITSYLEIRGNIQNLQAYRNASDRLEIEMAGIVVKAGYTPDGKDPEGFKPLDDKLFRLRLAGLNALELLHHFVNVFAAWMAVIAKADKREREPIDYRLHLIGVVERQTPHQERFFRGLSSSGEFKDLVLKVVRSGAHESNHRASPMPLSTEERCVMIDA